MNSPVDSPTTAPRANDFDPTRPWWRLLRPEDVYILLYMAITAGIIVLRWNQMEAPVAHLLARVGIGAFILLYVPFAQRRGTEWLALLRDLYYMLVFIFFYTETSALHLSLWGGRSFDDAIASLDQILFGFQPSLRFERACPQVWFSELMNFCYTFYYFLFILGGLVVWLQRDAGRGYGRMLHAVVLTMLFCYLLFDFFPTLGPQYRWNEVHTRDHMGGYFWKYVLDSILEFGERPTGAFPSSHVALATVFLLAFWRHARTAFWVALPLCLGLSASTVYICVHYFVDVPAGFVVGLVGWYVSEPVRWAVVRRFGLFPFSPRVAGGPKG